MAFLHAEAGQSYGGDEIKEVGGKERGTVLRVWIWGNLKAGQWRSGRVKIAQSISL